jgi:hypothetical protein
VRWSHRLRRRATGIMQRPVRSLSLRLIGRLCDKSVVTASTLGEVDKGDRGVRRRFSAVIKVLDCERSQLHKEVRQPSVELVEESALVCRAAGVESGARAGDELMVEAFRRTAWCGGVKCSDEESGAAGAGEERRVRKRPAKSANDSGQQRCAGRRICVAPDAPGRAPLTAAARRAKLEERGRVGACKNGRGHVRERCQR